MPTTIRRATAADAEALADLFWRSREANRATIPMVVHPRPTVVPFLRHVVASDEVWVADRGVPVAFLALGNGVLEHLYVAPGRTGEGTGSRLLELAKERRPDGLTLWTFVTNEGARRFYERHGFVVVGGTEGENEEGAPDLLLRWTPPSPQVAGPVEVEDRA